MIDKIKYLLIIFLLNVPIYSQVNVKGIIKNYNNEPIKYITIQISNLKLQTHSNQKGEFEFQNIPAGEHRFYLFGSGARPKDTIIYISSTTNNLIILIEDSYRIISIVLLIIYIQ